MTSRSVLTTLAPEQVHKFRYRVFDMVMISDIALDQLIVDHSNVAPSMEVVSTNLDKETFRAVDQGVLWKTARTCFEISVPNIAKIRVTGGHRISFKATAGACQAQIETLILSVGLGALMQQRGAFLLHAATFETTKGAIALAGVSCSGKSLLLSALNKRGYPMIADDITVIETYADELCVPPAWPSLALMPDAFAPLGLKQATSEALSKTGKCNVRGIAFSKQKKRLDQIIFLNWTPFDEILMRKIKGVQAVSKLSNTVYRRTFLQGMGLLEGHFKSLNRIAAQARFCTLTRPHDLRILDRVIDQIETSLELRPPTLLN